MPGMRRIVTPYLTAARPGLWSAVLVGNGKKHEEKTKQTYGVKIVAGLIFGANDPQSNPVHRQNPKCRAE